MAGSLRKSALTFSFALVGAMGLLLGLIAMSGCADTSMVASLPAANFDGPMMMQQPRPLPPIARAPAPPRARSVNRTAVPAGWIPPVAPRDWKWIIIHHSATATGGAKAFDAMHRAKGWDELGYDFVIGNGTDTADGQIEVGPRWTQQKWGAHARTPDNRYNLYGIGICLVGNFDLTYPTAKQIQSLTRLTAYLMRTYHITPQDVLGHGQTKPTDCPGRHMNVAEIRRLAMEVNLTLAQDQGDAIAEKEATAQDSAQPTAGTELMHESR